MGWSLLVLVVTACGKFGADDPTTSSSSSSSGGAPDAGTIQGAPVLADASIRELARATCEMYEKCARAALAPYGDVAACADRTALDLRSQLLAPDVGVGDGDLTTCARSVRAAGCASTFMALPGCDFRGRRANGDVCGSGAQCASGWCKAKSSSFSPCGTCYPRVGEGQPCRSNDECARGLSCPRGFCRRYAADGEACNVEAVCAPTLQCAKDQKCRPSLAPGADCSDTLSCSVLDGTLCNTATNQCNDVALAASGEACGSIEPTTYRNPMCSGGYCNSGKCAAWASDGAACTPSSCQPPARCVGRDPTCRVINAGECQ